MKALEGSKRHEIMLNDLMSDEEIAEKLRRAMLDKAIAIQKYPAYTQFWCEGDQIQIGWRYHNVPKFFLTVDDGNLLRQLLASTITPENSSFSSSSL